MNRILQNMPPVVKNLLILNVILWLAMSFVPVIDSRLMQWCALHYFTSPAFNVAQLVTQILREFYGLPAAGSPAPAPAPDQDGDNVFRLEDFF